MGCKWSSLNDPAIYTPLPNTFLGVGGIVFSHYLAERRARAFARLRSKRSSARAERRCARSQGKRSRPAGLRDLSSVYAGRRIAAASPRPRDLFAASLFLPPPRRKQAAIGDSTAPNGMVSRYNQLDDMKRA